MIVSGLYEGLESDEGLLTAGELTGRLISDFARIEAPAYRSNCGSVISFPLSQFLFETFKFFIRRKLRFVYHLRHALNLFDLGPDGQ